MNCPKCNEKACICTQARGATTLLGASAGGYVAATAGAKTGAVVGSFFCPGIGTAIGGLLGILTGAAAGAVKQDFTNNPLANMNYFYDLIGNRTSATENSATTTYTSNIVNQYTAVNAVVPVYDFDGNMTSYNGWTYTYNGENRLIVAENAADGVRVEADYDYMGRRLFKKVYNNNTLTKHSVFIYDGFKQIAEFDALNNNSLKASYLWQPIDLDVVLLRNNEYLVADGNKNIIQVRNGSGSVTDSYGYDPFGKVTHNGSSENPFQFSSEIFDDETELVYYNYRYYNPNLGRWINRDPIEEQGGWNLYVMVGNNMNNTFDKKGLDCCGGKKLKQNECCHKNIVMRISEDIGVQDKNCCVKLVKICITSRILHQNICIGHDCYSFAIRDDISYWQRIFSRFFDSGHTYKDEYGKEEKCFKVKKSVAASLKYSMDLQVGERYPYHLTNIGTWGSNCRSYSQTFYDEFSSKKYSGDLPECQR